MYINFHTHRATSECEMEIVQVFNSETIKNLKCFSFGLLPEHVSEEPHWMQWEHLIASKHCVAVGECGIDKRVSADLNLQIGFFSKWIDLAMGAQKPLIVHCVRAFNEVINVLQDKQFNFPVIFHGFNNSPATAELIVSKGYCLSFGKALLGYDSPASHSICKTPKSQLFLETDAADISIKYIYHKASRLLGVDETALKTQIQTNVQRVFKLKEL